MMTPMEKEILDYLRTSCKCTPCALEQLQEELWGSEIAKVTAMVAISNLRKKLPQGAILTLRPLEEGTGPRYQLIDSNSTE